MRVSYDISINVKVEGIDRYIEIASPEYCNPTYNLGEMFRACMNWDYSQGEYYKCSEIMSRIECGINSLTYNRIDYEKYNPANGWGNINDALEVLESIRDCIYETEKTRVIPIEHLYLRW